jgi:hypothetical protein
MIVARPRWVRGLAILLAGLTAWWMPLAAAAADELAFTIKDRRVTESSGLATDTAGERYWTVNDSGSSGIAYALSPNGDTEGTVRFLADPADIEAIAMTDDQLFLADIGDNRRRRQYVTVFVIDDPEPNDETRTYRAYDFAYPDGPHDSETLLVDGRGRFYFVTKEARGGIYRAPLNPIRQGVNDLRRVGDAPPFVTDGTFLPGDDQLALRTYVSVALLDAGSYRVVGQSPVPLQPQGESLTMDLNGEDLLVGSEGIRSRVYRMPVPKSIISILRPSASPPPSPTPTPSPTASGTEEDTGEEIEPPLALEDPGGTLVAVTLAGVVALAAAGTVILTRRR